jgi:protocatechuate 3,4-dioxygenase beta subunit
MVIAALPALSQTAPSASKQASVSTGGLYRIAGTVLNAVTGEPVRRATIAVLAESDSRTVESVEADNDGRFALGQLPAAKYQLTASKRGFRTAFYDEHDEYSTAIVAGPGQDTGGLSFRLMPNAVLHGVVTADGGDPVEGARVMLFIEPPDHGRDHTHARGPNERISQTDATTTDDTGAYEFSNLAAGKYLLAITAEPWYALHHSAGNSKPRPVSDAGAALDVAYSTTFYDSTTDEASAMPIVLAGGSREEANITLHAVPALHLVVETPHKPDGSIARPELRQSVFGAQISAESAGFVDAQKTGTVEFSGVAPGHYELAQGDPPRIVDLDATASQQVDPGDGVPAVSVSGVLRFAAGFAPPDDVTVALYSADGSGLPGSGLPGSGRPDQLVTTARKGSFRFDTVLPGKFELWAWSSGKLLPIVSITGNGTTRAGDTLTVRDRPLSIIATVTQGETEVRGFARKAAGVENEGKGQAGAMVVLVPQDTRAFQALVRRDQSDSDGSFSLHDISPGQYTVVAIEDGWALDWTQPEVMSRFIAQGISITVSEKSGKLIQLSQPVPVQTRQ